MRSHKLAALLSATLLAPALALSGCAQQANIDFDDSDTSEAPAEAQPDTGDTVPDEAPSLALGERPDWAINPIDIGTLVAEQQSDTWNVKVFRAGNARTTSTGVWTMPDTGEAVMPEGTAMTVYNVVFTNISPEDMVLDGPAATTLIHHGVEEFRASLTSLDDSMTAPFGLAVHPFDPQMEDDMPEYGDRRGHTVRPGESFSVPTNTWAVPGEISAATYINVMDDDGKRRPKVSEVLSLTITQ